MHHCADACVIACISEGVKNRINRYAANRECRFLRDGNFVDVVTGEVISSIQQVTFDGKVMQPYENFADELMHRMMENPLTDEKFYFSVGYSSEEISRIKPVFVSRMPVRKANGILHQETIRSAKALNSGVVISRKNIRDLKLGGDGEIQDYYEKAKRDDRLLYEALKNRLIEFNGNAAAAFKDGFYKPLSMAVKGMQSKKLRL